MHDTTKEEIRSNTTSSLLDEFAELVKRMQRDQERYNFIKHEITRRSGKDEVHIRTLDNLAMEPAK